MTDERTQAENEIAKLAKFSSENPNPVLRTDGEGTILYANDGSAPLLDEWGCKVGEPVPDDHSRIVGNVLGSGVPTSVEMSCGDRDFSLTFAPIPDTDQVNLYGLDITERKRAEGALRSSLHEKEVLLREVHHRVKNNLQVVNSLLRLHAREVEDERLLEVLTDIQNRIKAMALVHEALCMEDVAHVDCRAYIRTLAHELYRAYGADASGVTFHLTGEDIVLSIDKAVPCGQILTELISNSLEHAFPQGWKGQGRVEVGLGHLEGGEIELVVSDNGVGMPAEVDAGDSHFLGLHLVKMLAEDQLGGSVETHTEDGTRVEIRFVGG